MKGLRLNKLFYVAIVFVFTLAVVLLNESCTTESAPTKLVSSNSLQKNIPDKIDFIFHVKPILSDRCFKCHGPDKAKIEGDLQLHTKEAAFASLGEERYAIIPNDVENSELIKRIFSEDQAEIMPPPESNLTLSNYEKEILKKWVAQGAEWKPHWAFVPPVDPKIPNITNTKWVANDIDHFILEKLEAQNLNPSPKIRPEKLIRRLSFDLTGLPPSIEVIDAYKADPSVENYNRIIDQFMNSESFAERMTNDWLELARYADTHGYQDDLERTMWPWRDWVIHAFKKNMPYDQFVKWQLAGDLIPNATKEQIVATAFNRNHKITQEGGVISEEYRAEYVTDRTNTFATAFLGLTFECAKCHDHKYDPISQKEYFELFSYFNNVNEKGLIEEYGQIPEPYIKLSKEEIANTLTFINNLDTLDDIPLLVMEELDQPRQTHILNRGEYDKPLEPVNANVPSFGSKNERKAFKDRLALVDWLFSDENPLAARVMVNRLWQQIFGKGIVSTSYDFGNQGSLPTHPELLDHLAVKFRNENWDIRKMLKYIVNSSTYQQETSVDKNLLEIDPDNNLLARAPRARLSAEMIRDHALSISGLLVSKVGGPSVKPYQPKGLWNEVTGGGGGSTAKYVQDEGENNYRRSLYTFRKRTVPPPNMSLFDSPSRDFCMVQRENTSTPLQALVLLNDPQYLEAAIALSNKTYTNSENESEVIPTMFYLATSRPISEEELEVLRKIYSEELNRFGENQNALKAFLKYGNVEIDDTVKSKVAAYAVVANAIFNLDETIRKS